MTARCVGRRRPYLHLAIAASLAVLTGGVVVACYPGGGGGTEPPGNSLYFPQGLGTSQYGHVLYVANSDFDLQFNGGTLQSYDLGKLRLDAAGLIDLNLGLRTDNPIPPNRILVSNWSPSQCQSPAGTTGPGANGARLPLGQACAPPIDPGLYLRHSVAIGAFATEIQISTQPNAAAFPADAGPPPGARLFMPVRGNASVTYADLAPDYFFEETPDAGIDPSVFAMDCGQGSGSRCQNQAGNTIVAADTRQVTLPGEPFGLALTPDETGMVVTHQASNQTSVLLTGLGGTGTNNAVPSMQFILTGVPTAGSGIVAVPHDDSVHSPAPGCEVPGVGQPCVLPAFFETNHSTAEIDLLRYFNDDGSSQQRPFLNREVAYTLTATQGGIDTRGIVIDPSPRIACRYKVNPGDPGPIDPCNTQPLDSPQCQQWIACGMVPSRVFIASRSPASLVVGTVGGPSASGDGSFDPDRLALTDVVPLAAGPSNVYLAPIVDSSGNLVLRVFIVCFDSNQIFVYDPDNQVIENVINVGGGPFAMTFDPFDIRRVADHLPAVAPNVSAYRFGYVALFTNSYLQMIDLDDSNAAVSPFTFENVVFTLGTPTQPKGT